MQILCWYYFVTLYKTLNDYFSVLTDISAIIMLVLFKKKKDIFFSCDDSLSFNSACVSVCPTKSPTPQKHPPKNKCVHTHAHSQLQSHTDSQKLVNLGLSKKFTSYKLKKNGTLQHPAADTNHSKILTSSQVSRHIPVIVQRANQSC